MFVEDDFAFVKGQITHHQRQVARHSKDGNDGGLSRHSGLANRFKDFLDKMQDANKRPAQREPVALNEKEIGHRFGDLGDLPPEIRSQLVTANYDELEAKIRQTVDSLFDGVASIDEIFVALWRQEEVKEREFLARKIYRMTTKNLLFSYQNRKGVYSTADLSEEGGAEADTSTDTNTATDQ